MFKPHFRDHETQIIAVHEIEQDPEFVSIDGLGVTSADLHEHWRSKRMTNAEILTAVRRAEEPVGFSMSRAFGLLRRSRESVSTTWVWRRFRR